MWLWRRFFHVLYQFPVWWFFFFFLRLARFFVRYRKELDSYHTVGNNHNCWHIFLNLTRIVHLIPRGRLFFARFGIICWNFSSLPVVKDRYSKVFDVLIADKPLPSSNGSRDVSVTITYDDVCPAESGRTLAALFVALSKSQLHP